MVLGQGRQRQSYSELSYIFTTNIVQVGRLNLLTPSRISSAARLIQTGDLIPVNLPLPDPSVPAFDREPFVHTIKETVPNLIFDDTYHLNTQSGTQFDGFRHFAHLLSGRFYNGATADDFRSTTGEHKCSVHHLANHGIAGRGVLIDVAAWAAGQGKPIDPWTRHEISYADVLAAGRSQGIDIRPAAKGGDILPGDILFVRSGWTASYASLSASQREKLGHRKTAAGQENETVFAGMSQEQEVKEWLHDCYFAAVAGDSPTFEAWPAKAPGEYLHEHLLSLWGVLIGEMLDLERLAETCRKLGRWTFFFAAAPANVPGGVGTHVNGQAIF